MTKPTYGTVRERVRILGWPQLLVRDKRSESGVRSPDSGPASLSEAAAGTSAIIPTGTRTRTADAQRAQTTVLTIDTPEFYMNLRADTSLAQHSVVHCWSVVHCQSVVHCLCVIVGPVHKCVDIRLVRGQKSAEHTPQTTGTRTSTLLKKYENETRSQHGRTGTLPLAGTNTVGFALVATRTRRKSKTGLDVFVLVPGSWYPWLGCRLRSAHHRQALKPQPV
eukprot:scaffold65329_cov24-Prasinocladus_malaysianus.AAC.1